MDIVCAIDLGATHSGYAFSSKKEYNEDMFKIHLNEEWMSGHANLHTFKTPTILLLSPDKSLHSFGYDAERKYHKLMEGKNHDQYYYFKRFKADLKNKQFRKDTIIEEEGGKSMNGIAIFSLALKFLRSHFLDALGVGDKYSSSDTLAKGYAARYVITVPTKWDNYAIDCMKAAAKKAGVVPCSIVTESEAAGRYCRLFPLRPPGRSSFHIPKPGTSHLIVNLGGTNIDTAVREIKQDGTINEFDKNLGNSSGATRVDVEYIKFLNKLFGTEFIEVYAKKYRVDFLSLQYEFDTRKRGFSMESDEGTCIRLPQSLIKAYTTKYKQSLQFMIDDTDYVGKILSKDDCFILDKSVMKELFGPAVKSTVGYLTNLSRDPEAKQSDVIILVGGFADSPVVIGAVRFYFPNASIVVPDEPELAVLMGGVMVGHNPDSKIIIQSKYTCGIGIAVPFNSAVHPEDKMFVSGGKRFCSDIFQCHIEQGRLLEIGEFCNQRHLLPNRTRQKTITLPVYASNQRTVRFTTDDGCMLLGKINVKLQEIKNDNPNMKVNIRMTILGNSLIVEVFDEANGVVVSSAFTLSRDRPSSL